MRAQNPFFWPFEQIFSNFSTVGSQNATEYWPQSALTTRPAVISKISLADFPVVLLDGLSDFGANRADGILLCLILPVIGLVGALAAGGRGYFDLIFPLLSGFVLVSPIAAFAFFEMSRRRGLDQRAGWRDALGLFASPAIGSVIVLSLILVSLFILWVSIAHFLYLDLMAPHLPKSLDALVIRTFTTAPGWHLLIIGYAVGLIFAIAVLALTVVAFPVVLDRPIGLLAAISLSFRAFAMNFFPLMVWGLIVSLLLAIGTGLFLLGLVVVLPVLGHATWHLYRRLIHF